MGRFYTETRRCFATAACTASITLTVGATDSQRKDEQAVQQLLAANGWGQGLHGAVCPAHRPGQLAGR